MIIHECTINTVLPVDNFEELREKDIRYSNKKIICLEEKELIEKLMNDLKKALSINSSSADNKVPKNKNYYYKFKINNLKESEKNMKNKEFKINDNVQFDSEETKEQLQKYFDVVNEYNREIQNGEDPGISMDELLNKYREIFYDEKLENKIKDIDSTKEKFNNSDINELLIKINSKIKELDEKSN